MNFHHLLTIGLLSLGFSGMPLSRPTTPAQAVALVRPVSDTAIAIVHRDEDAEHIPWRADKLLNWEDFQCAPRRGTEAVASTSTSLGIAYQVVNGQLTYRITCQFSKVKSWGLMKTDYILAHEQAHFDITEIYARKLHEALAGYVFDRRSFRKDISDIYQKIVDGKEAMQHQYDSETDHSRNRKLQFEWLERIQAELDSSEAWAAYP